MLSNLLTDRKSRIPRIWSNKELKKFAHMFNGNIINVSGWQDKDKEGKRYSDYFLNKSSYTISNYVSDARGFQGNENEIFLDLTIDIPSEMKEKYDVVFNHTVLEHVFETRKAFKNLCDLSSDVVIVVVPFLQPMHADYGDFWRFTPLCIQRMFEENGLTVLYSSFNDPINASVYVFCIATKNNQKWTKTISSNVQSDGQVNIMTRAIFEDGQAPMVGTNVLFNFGPWISLKYANSKKFILNIFRRNKSQK